MAGITGTQHRCGSIACMVKGQAIRLYHIPYKNGLSCGRYWLCDFHQTKWNKHYTIGVVTIQNVD